MSETYHASALRRLNNEFGKFTIQLGIAPKFMYILGVYGRKSGKLRTTPVALVLHENQRFIVSPFGNVNWVQNARASGEVTLSQGRKHEVVKIQELTASECAPILKMYVALEPITLPFFKSKADSPLESFEKEAADHPVFRVGKA